MLVFFVPRFFFITWVIVVSLQMHGYRSCLEKERKGLLELNAYVNSEFPYDWPNDTDSDCCQWERVKCNFTTGRAANGKESSVILQLEVWLASS